MSDRKLIKDQEYLILKGKKEPADLKSVQTNPAYHGLSKLMGRHPLSKTKWYSIRLNLDKVCWFDPERESTRCLISVKPVGDRCHKCQHAPPKPPGDSRCNLTSMADLQTAEEKLRCSDFTLASSLISFSVAFFCWTHVIAVYFYPFPSLANRESPVDS